MKVYPVLPYDLIQGVRLCHALMETNFRICIPKEHDKKFLKLKEKFGIKYELGVESAFHLKDIKINHKVPITSLGSIQRYLIFPNSLLKYCKSLWRENRNIKISFAGKVTSKRRSVISSYLKKNYGEQITLPKIKPRWVKTLNNIYRLINIKPKIFSSSIEIKDMLIWSSNRGRTFPVKSWDQDYYDLLARSKFVLCPSGDFVWTYRFFESILCGAIPVVEEDCRCYQGFKYYKMDDRIEDIEWDRDIALRNYELCLEKISVPVDKINHELSQICGN